MNYIIHYDVAAVIITVTVMLHFFFKKIINTKQTNIFVVLMWIALVSNVFDLLTIYTIDNHESIPVWLNTILNQIYLISFNSISLLYYIYIAVATEGKGEVTGIQRLVTGAPCMIVTALVLTTPWTGLIFYFDDGGIYTHGSLMLGMYLEAMLYVLAAFVHMLIYKKRLTIVQKVTITAYTFASIGSVIMQILLPHVLLLQFVVSLSGLLIYLSMENPSDYADKLIGTYNRMAFNKIMEITVDKEKHFELLGVQIEGMRYIKETLGADNGNLLLKDIADFLLGLDKKYKVFYLPNYKFVILREGKCVGWDEEINRIHGRFRSPFVSGGVELSLDVFMCTIAGAGNITRYENVLDMLEYGLEEAVSVGDEAVVCAGEDILEKARREHVILRFMRQALREKTFQVYFQPIYCVEKKRYTSAEALIRMPVSEELGFISPEEFIPLAEKNGLILSIGEFVFKEVCDFMTRESVWEYGIESVDVNLSVVQCMQEKLYERLLDIMDEYKLKYSCINLEITETAAVISGETLRGNMEKLMEKGVKFSMDDYGTGFSNTSNIIEFPFDIIKLDKSMVWSAMENDKAMCALRHTISMIKDMHMELIAEGVENQEQAECLEGMGCDFFQGYFYSKPVNKEEFLRIIA